MPKSQHTQAVVVDRAEEEAVRRWAADRGVKVGVYPERGIEPVTTVTLALVGTVAAINAVQQLLFERRKGGQVIDLRRDPAEAFYRTSNLEYGTVVIYAPDGKVTVMIKNPEDTFGKLISALPRLLSGNNGAKQISHVLSSTFGPDVRVDTDENPGADA